MGMVVIFITSLPHWREKQREEKKLLVSTLDVMFVSILDSTCICIFVPYQEQTTKIQNKWFSWHIHQLLFSYIQDSRARCEISFNANIKSHAQNKLKLTEIWYTLSSCVSHMNFLLNMHSIYMTVIVMHIDSMNFPKINVEEG